MTDLELAFAQDPQSTAYVPLCVAYIEQARFMEAMVVCKKGIKAHPESIDARILLARVYAEQKKYKRAIQELDELTKSHGERAAICLARAKWRAASDNEAGAIEDLKKAIDLDASLDEAKQLLRDRSITYPAPPSPPPTPLPMRAGLLSQFTPPPIDGVSGPMSGILRSPSAVRVSMHRESVSGLLPLPPPLTTDEAQEQEMAQAYAAVLQRQMSGIVRPAPFPIQAEGGAGLSPDIQAQYGYGYAPPRLEGENELEVLAQEVAAEKPSRGKAKSSVVLGIVLFVIGVGLVGYRVQWKRTTEAIALLSQQGTDAFNLDTYGSYKKAADHFEKILEEYDDRHAPTLGRLAHVYAILWGEHGETELKPKLDEMLSRAEKHAPEISHTLAARGLSLLYEGKDRQRAAAKAYEALAATVQKARDSQGAPSYADLTMSVIDLELGNYETATTNLGHVKQVLPGSARAKVWHARAAFRANRLGTAESAFQEALRASPGHPGARAGLALVRLERGDLQLAAGEVVQFDDYAKKYPKEVSTKDTALAEFARSEVFRSAGEEARATGAYEMAIRLDPDNAYFPFGLGRGLLGQQKAKEAIPHLKKAVDMEPTRSAFLIALAEAEMQVEENKSAEDHIEAAMKQSPQYLPAAMAKARLLRRTKRPGLEEYLGGVLKWSNAVVEVNLELGRYYRGVGRLDAAKTALEQSIAGMTQHPHPEQAEVLLSYAKVLEDKEDPAGAITAYREAGTKGSLEAWFRVAQILSRGTKEERKTALEACERYLAAGESLRYSDQARPLCASLR